MTTTLRPARPAAATAVAAAATATADGASAPAMRLLQHEADVRRLPTEQALLFHLANEVRGLTRYGSALVFRRHRGSGRMRLVQASDLPAVDRDAPLTQALEARIAALDSASLLAAPALLPTRDPDTTAPAADHAAVLAAYPFGHLLWLPLPQRRRPALAPSASGAAAQAPRRINAGVLFAREQAFTLGEQTLLARLAETYAHAWAALRVRRRFAIGLPLNGRWAAVAGVALAAVALMPVRLSVMAPVEVVPAEPLLVTAPIAGVVKTILVAPNSAVQAGQALLQFEDIQPRNELVLAQQRLAVARARDARTRAAAFKDPVAAHDMSAARAELELARVTADYAQEVLQRTRVLSPRAGLAIYTDRRDWEGRAVQLGEEILKVADPARVALRVDLSTADNIALQVGTPISVYLDNAPLGGLQARLRSVSYSPRSLPDGSSSYTVMADPLPGQAANLAAGTGARIGARGTARLYGARVPLILQLVRRPLAAVRQFVGW